MKVLEPARVLRRATGPKGAYCRRRHNLNRLPMMAYVNLSSAFFVCMSACKRNDVDFNVVASERSEFNSEMCGPQLVSRATESKRPSDVKDSTSLIPTTQRHRSQRNPFVSRRTLCFTMRKIIAGNAPRSSHAFP